MTPADILALRLALDLTQSELARKLNVETATISRWENGHFQPDKPRQAALHRLAKRLEKEKK